MTFASGSDPQRGTSPSLTRPAGRARAPLTAPEPRTGHRALLLPKRAPLGPSRPALPGKRGDAGALELDFPALAPRAQHLAQVHGGAVAQLPREAAELVAAVAVRRGLRARRHPVPAEEQRGLGLRRRRVGRGRLQPQQRQRRQRHGHEPRVLQRAGPHPSEAGSGHGPRAALLRGVHGQRAQSQVVKAQRAQPAPAALGLLHGRTSRAAPGPAPRRPQQPRG